jgi:hypothetical protein
MKHRAEPLDAARIPPAAALNESNAPAGAVGSALLTPEQAAKYLGFTVGWMAKLRMRGGGPNWIRLGTKCRYTLADLDEWISAHRVSTTSQQSKAERLRP